MNHFAQAEQLLARAAECRVAVIERSLVARAAVHAQLAHTQAFEQAHGLPPATNGAELSDDALAAYGLPVRVPTLETRPATGERL